MVDLHQLLLALLLPPASPAPVSQSNPRALQLFPSLPALQLFLFLQALPTYLPLPAPGLSLSPRAQPLLLSPRVRLPFLSLQAPPHLPCRHLLLQFLRQMFLPLHLLFHRLLQALRQCQLPVVRHARRMLTTAAWMVSLYSCKSFHISYPSVRLAYNACADKANTSKTGGGNVDVSISPAIYTA